MHMPRTCYVLRQRDQMRQSSEASLGTARQQAPGNPRNPAARPGHDPNPDPDPGPSPGPGFGPDPVFHPIEPAARARARSPRPTMSVAPSPP